MKLNNKDQWDYSNNQSFSKKIADISCDIKDQITSYMMSFDILGVNSLMVEIKKNRLIISGVRDSNMVTESFDLNHRPEGRFKKIFMLPDLVMAEKIASECKDGILQVILPKQTAPGKKSAGGPMVPSVA